MSATLKSPSVTNYGDNAVLIDWSIDGFDARVSDAVHALAGALRQTEAFVEIMPGYDSVVASFDAAVMRLDTAKTLISDAFVATLSQTETTGSDASRLIEIPVAYGGADGPDLYAMADRIGRSPEAVIALHSEREYRVCMMGFIPGFAFLSEVDPILQHPRHATPRMQVPAGSVGIANWQTGIYGLESPGGWQIIGRTDLDMFDAMREAPFLVEAGDRIRFVPK